MRTFYHRHARNCCCPLRVGSLRRRPIAANQPWVSAGGGRRPRLPLAAAFSTSPRLSRPARGPRASPLHASPPASHILRCDPRAPRCLSPAVTSLTSCPARSLLSTLPRLQWSPLLLGHPRDVPASAPFPSLLPLPAVRCPPRLHGPPTAQERTHISGSLPQRPQHFLAASLALVFPHSHVSLSNIYFIFLYLQSSPGKCVMVKADV